MWFKSLPALPQFASTTQGVRVGNGQCVAVLFIIPIVVDIQINSLKAKLRE